MTTITATQASRSFSALLDAVGRDESFTITRDGRPVAELRPVTSRPLGALLSHLDQLKTDPGYADDVRAARSAVNQPWTNPWPTT